MIQGVIDKNYSLVRLCWFWYYFLMEDDLVIFIQNLVITIITILFLTVSGSFYLDLIFGLTGCFLIYYFTEMI